MSKLIQFTAADAAGRVAARLLELAERFGEPGPDGAVVIELPLTQEELRIADTHGDAGSSDLPLSVLRRAA